MSYLFVEDHRDYVAREYKRRVERRPQYSQRAYARDLGIAPATLTGYLKNQFKLSDARIRTLADILNLTFEQIEHWKDLSELQFCKDNSKRNALSRRIAERIGSEKNNLTEDEFKVVSDWYYLAYLELIQMDSATYSNLSMAASALELPVETMQECRERLKKVRLIEEDIHTGKLQVLENTYVYNEMPSAAVRHFHRQVLGKALQALDQQSVQERYNSSTFIAVPEEKIQEITKEMNLFAIRLLEPYTTQKAKKQKLYCLSLQFFNLIHQKDKNASTI